MGKLFNYHRLRQRWDNPRHGFTLVELIVVLVIIGILAAIAYVAYAALIKDSATKAAQATAESVNREAIALAAFDGVAPSERVNDVLDDPENGFTQPVSATNDAGVVPAHLTHGFALLSVQPASLPTDGETWEKGDITITYRTGGTYLFANTDSGANNVIYEPSTVPGTATGVICATTDDTTCADGQTLASGGAGGDEGEGGEPAAAGVDLYGTGSEWDEFTPVSVSVTKGTCVDYGGGNYQIEFSAGSLMNTHWGVYNWDGLNMRWWNVSIDTTSVMFPTTKFIADSDGTTLDVVITDDDGSGGGAPGVTTGRSAVITWDISECTPAP